MITIPKMTPLRAFAYFNLAIVAILLLMFGFLFVRPKLVIDRVLPSGAVGYIRLEHPVDHFNRVVKSDFWKNISAIDVPAVLQRNNVPQETIDQFNQARGQMDEFLKNPYVQKTLKKEIVVALYSHDKAKPGDGHGPKVGMILAVHLPPVLQVAESFTRLMSKIQGQPQEEFLGTSIVHLKDKQAKEILQYVRIRDVLLVGIEEEGLLKDVIRAHKKQIHSMAMDKNFKLGLSRAYPNAQGHLYVHVPTISQVLLNSSPSSSQLPGIHSYSISYQPGSFDKYKLIFTLDPVKPSIQEKEFSPCASVDNSALPFVPGGVAWYQWAGCQNYSRLWAQLRQNIVQMGDASDQVISSKKKLERYFGVKVSRDVIPLLGNEVGGYLTDVDTQGMFPYPRFLSFIKVKDKTKAQELMQKFGKTPFGAFKDETYEDVPIRYLPMQIGANMEIGYCFLGDYLLAATSMQLLKKSIDTYKNPQRSIKEDKTYLSLELDKSKEVRQMWFIKISEMAKRLRGLIDWTNKYLTSQVTLATTYKSDGEQKTLELKGEIKEKEAELVLASQKLKEYKEKPPVEDDVNMVEATVNRLQRDIVEISGDIESKKNEIEEIAQTLHLYEGQSIGAKQFMYNSQFVLKPLLSGLETLKVVGGKVMSSTKYIETELYFY